MGGQIKPGVFVFFTDPQRGHERHELDQHHGDNHREDADNDKAANLRVPCACSKDCDHDGSKDPADTVDGEDVQCIVYFQAVAHQIYRLLAQDACD